MLFIQNSGNKTDDTEWGKADVNFVCLKEQRINCPTLSIQKMYCNICLCLLLLFADIIKDVPLSINAIVTKTGRFCSKVHHLLSCVLQKRNKNVKKNSNRFFDTKNPVRCDGKYHQPSVARRINHFCNILWKKWPLKTLYGLVVPALSFSFCLFALAFFLYCSKIDFMTVPKYCKYGGRSTKCRVCTVLVLYGTSTYY